MRTDEIREAYQAFFEERGHLRVPSASLIPSPEDTSTLLTVAALLETAWALAHGLSDNLATRNHRRT